MSLLASLADALSEQTFAGHSVKVLLDSDGRATSEAYTQIRLGAPRWRKLPAGPDWGYRATAAVTNTVTGESATFTDGDESTLLDNANATTITALTATAYQDAVTGAPVAGPLVEDRDWSLGAFTPSTINNAVLWLDDAVVLPANAATLTIDYSYETRQFSRVVPRLTTIPAFIHAKDTATEHRATISEDVARALETWASGQVGTPITSSAGVLEPMVYWAMPETAPLSVDSMARDVNVQRVALRFSDVRSYDEGGVVRRVGTAQPAIQPEL